MNPSDTPKSKRFYIISFYKELFEPFAQYDYTVGGNRRILMEIPGSSGIVPTTLSQYASINDKSGLDQRSLDEYFSRNTTLSYGMAVIPWIETTYAIGNVIGSVSGRQINVNSVVVGRSFNFLAQTTTLRFSDERYR